MSGPGGRLPRFRVKSFRAASEFRRRWHRGAMVPLDSPARRTPSETRAGNNIHRYSLPIFSDSAVKLSTSKQKRFCALLSFMLLAHMVGVYFYSAPCEADNDLVMGPVDVGRRPLLPFVSSIG